MPALKLKPLAAGALILAATLFLAACGSDDAEFEAFPETPVEELYNSAFDALVAGETKTAVELFDEVERQHPYSPWATRAQLMSAFALYQSNRYDEAVAALDRFIELHPGNEDVVYAQYLKGISFYEQISDVGRDQSMTRLALINLGQVVQRFPETPYARDAGLKIDLTRDHLAGKHMEIGRFYLRRGSYLASINRFRSVIRDYQTTTHVPEALHRLVESYLALGVVKEAQATAAVLGHNFPGSEWYMDSYQLLTGQDLRPESDENSWIEEIWESIT